MKQISLGLPLSQRRTRKRQFLDSMEQVVPWGDLVSLIEPYARESGRRGQQPVGVEVLLRIHFMQQWFNLSEPAMEEALHDTPVFRDFAGLSGWSDALPSDSSMLRFRRLLEEHKLAEQMRTKLQLVKATARHLRSVQRQPERIKSYFQHAPVRYAA